MRKSWGEFVAWTKRGLSVKLKYTRKIHLERLKKMMELDEPCCWCPAHIGFRYGDDHYYPTSSDPCRVCAETVGIELGEGPERITDSMWQGSKCPCFVLGKEEALRRTLEVLEEWEQ